MRLLLRLLISFAIAQGFVPRAPATLAVSDDFASHMVLQRGRAITVHGTGAPGESVTATLDGTSATATTTSDGSWSVSLPARVAGGPYTLTLVGPANTITLSDVLIGDVWLASGQSNMNFTMQPHPPFTFGVVDYQREIAAADHPDLRVFTTTTKNPATEAPRVYGSWTVCSPGTAGGYSGIAYYFGRRLQTQLKVPIGLVVSALGSTSINAWLDKPTLNRLGISTTGTGKFDPGNCFNGMIAPLTAVPMKGFIWYQGEADTPTAGTYAARLRALIGDWRGRWHDPAMPFYEVQLADYDPTRATPPGGSFDASWAKLRLAQAAALDVPLTGLATAADVGDPAFIHPRDKKTVGERLAAVALAATYGQPIVSTGPTYAAKQSDGGTLVIAYTPGSLGSGLVIKPGAALTGFDLAGADGIFYPATAAVSGRSMVLACQSVPHPQDARYAWGNAPILTLYNAEGFPALPFLTTAVPADSNGYPVQDPTAAHQDGSEGHWRFDGNGHDESGNAHALTLAGRPAFSTTDVKEGSGSLVLNGTDQSGDAGTYDVGARFTIAGWIKVAPGRSNIQTILSNSDGGNSAGFRLYVNHYGSNDGALVFETGNGRALLTADTPAGTVTPGIWQFIAVSADQTPGTARFYVDGVDRTSAAGNLTDYPTGGDVRIGRLGANGYYFGGLLDDLQILPGALTPPRIRALLIGGLSARWGFELNGGDASGHHHFLSAVGNATYAPGPAPVGNYSAALDGNGQYFSAGAYNLGSAYTISLWARLPAGASTVQTLVANSTGGAASGFQWSVNRHDGPGGRLVFATGNGTASAALSSAPGVFAPDAWNHVAVTVDHAAGTATLYCHGVALSATGTILPGAQTTGPLLLGALAGGDAALRGNLDDVRIYTRVLTPQEIATLAGINGD